VVAARLGSEGGGLAGVRVGVGGIVAVERLTSQEGCARLVVSNFGGGSAAVSSWDKGNIRASWCGAVEDVVTARRCATCSSGVSCGVGRV
jgi:N-methylhydantoinase A/oxoprolinase/acetone carboxylase beta subunit